MPIVYLLLIILAFVSSRLHWPLTSLAVIAGFLIATVDVLIQFIRVLMKRTHFSTLLGALALFFLSIGYLFFWLSWPGGFVMSCFGAIVALAFIVYWFIAKRKLNLRFGVVLTVFIVLSAFLSMKPSTFYCMKNDIDPHRPDAPIFILHELAWRYNREGNREAAMRLLLQEKQNIEAKQAYLAKEQRPDAYLIKDFEENELIVNAALDQLIKGGWTDYRPMAPEDFRLE